MDVDGYVPIAVLALAAGHIVSDPLGRSSDDSTACHAVGVVVRSHLVNQVDSASVCPSAGLGRHAVSYGGRPHCAKQSLGRGDEM